MIAVGTQLGPYEILSQLGAGGMGEVYRAKGTRLNRTVAINPASITLTFAPCTTSATRTVSITW
jgi:serine/threonine protein kinase